MGVATSADFHIPTIDISPYLKDSSTDAARQVVHDVRVACTTVGFFSMVGHGMPREIQDNVFRAARRLFALPPEEKRALRHPLLKNRGYELIGSQALQEDTLPDLKEVLPTSTDCPVYISNRYHRLSAGWAINKTSGLLYRQAHTGRVGEGQGTSRTTRREHISCRIPRLGVQTADRGVLLRRPRPISESAGDPR